MGEDGRRGARGGAAGGVDVDDEGEAGRAAVSRGEAVEGEVARATAQATGARQRERPSIPDMLPWPSTRKAQSA